MFRRNSSAISGSSGARVPASIRRRQFGNGRRRVRGGCGQHFRDLHGTGTEQPRGLVVSQRLQPVREIYIRGNRAAFQLHQYFDQVGKQRIECDKVNRRSPLRQCGHCLENMPVFRDVERIGGNVARRRKVE